MKRSMPEVSGTGELESLLLAVRSRAQAERLAGRALADTGRMKALMAIFLTGERLAAQRAAWVVGKCAERDLSFVGPYLPRMVRRMQDPAVHDAVRRCVVRILQCVEIPTPLMGSVATACFDYLADPDVPVAVRVFAMTVLDRLAEREPGLREELTLVIEQQLPYGSAAFHARAGRILRRRRNVRP